MFKERNPEIELFIKELEKRENTELVFNQYKGLGVQMNLRTYLNLALINKAEIILLGEASGYNGCRWTGIPFTSGDILRKHRLYAPVRNSLAFANFKDKKELSASIVYSFFSEYPEIFKKIVLWNTFPFHPHKAGESETNRTPTKTEIRQGAYYFKMLQDVLKIKEYHPIGNKASELLTMLINTGDIPPFKFKLIRHPAFGGAVDFAKNLKEIFKIKDRNRQKTLMEL
jgi:uracil-DNA glycosylase